MANPIESDGSTIWVAVIFVSTAIVSFCVNVIRDKRNRAFDADEREKKAAEVKTEMEIAVKLVKEDTAAIVSKVEDALHIKEGE